VVHDDGGGGRRLTQLHDVVDVVQQTLQVKGSSGRKACERE
jgi:hypothetical protein